MAVFIMNHTRSKGAAKANIRYIQHRPGKDGAKATRSLFGWDGVLGRIDAYRLVDTAEAGSSFFRMKISPDPKTEDEKRDLHLREVTERTMQAFEERLRKPVQWVAAEHDDHTAKRHVHVLAIAKGRLNREDLKGIIREATGACLEQRQELDHTLAQQARGEREEAAWERSHER